MSQYRVAHLSSAHPRNDIRIFRKQCRSLAANGYDVTLIVGDGLGDGCAEGVHVVDVGRASGRVARMRTTTQRVFAKAVALDADLYHLHDPELIPVGLQLKKLKKRVVFDSHEDTPTQILGKAYLTPLVRRAVSAVFARFANYACRQFDGIVAATPLIRDYFLAVNPRTVNVNNFPLLAECEGAIPWGGRRSEVSYVGNISRARGVCEVVRACESLRTEARVNLAGAFSDGILEAEVKTYPGWSRVNQCGFLDRSQIRTVLGRSVAGLVTLHPLRSYMESQPTKMFEYMSSGIAVIASDIPLWREIIERNNCGVCVNPLDPQAIARAIDHLVEHPDLARQMGANGRQAVLAQYNWSMEERTLLDFYSEVIPA